MIFTQTLQRIDPDKPEEALKKMYNHLKYMQERLEYTLLNLDSTNINEIDLKQTTVSDSTGSTDLSSFLYYVGKNGECFSVGKDIRGQFTFDLRGKDGKQTMYLNSSGELVITEHANLTIDGGEW